MAAIARKLITKAKLFLTRPCFNLDHHRLVSTRNIINSSPASSSGSIAAPAAAAATKTKTRPKLDPFFSPRTAEGLALEYGRDHQLWKVSFSSLSEKRLRLHLHLPRDEIIAVYVKFLATALKCDEEEAKKRICSVSTRHHLFFTCQVPVETAAHFFELDRTCDVDPVYEEDFQGEDFEETAEPFVGGKAVEYDPIYHKAMLKKFNTTRPSGDEVARRREGNPDIITPGVRCYGYYLL